MEWGFVHLLQQMEPVSESGMVLKANVIVDRSPKNSLSIVRGIIKDLHTVQFNAYTAEGILLKVMKLSLCLRFVTHYVTFLGQVNFHT